MVLRVGRKQRGELVARRRIILHGELEACHLHFVAGVPRIPFEESFVNGERLPRLVRPGVRARQIVQNCGVVRRGFQNLLIELDRLVVFALRSQKPGKFHLGVALVGILRHNAAVALNSGGRVLEFGLKIGDSLHSVFIVREAGEALFIVAQELLGRSAGRWAQPNPAGGFLGLRDILERLLILRIGWALASQGLENGACVVEMVGPIEYERLPLQGIVVGRRSF